ncbi:DUF2007 domain-containing protein [Bizionia argentinensis JUB59]|uniref:DUF2007 domain-containing protein n=1 Tax=Bizionia argentinensis JUB59 TaxID=1046627 RepID=G2EH31_9FLAO|nr:DUF2007 domain-containing protein [Bizionia argentinensis]EGV42155.2 DUF2007 domain-containing protein [Bizionia argentinensis JUB59]
MQDTFTTIAVFQYTSEAEIIKGRLEAEGISVFLLDNHTINTNPIVSNAIGGVKLKVLSGQEKEAKEILNSISTYSMDNVAQVIKCPNCHKTQIELFSTIKDFKSFMTFLGDFILGKSPFHTRYNYRCEACQTEFPTE